MEDIQKILNGFNADIPTVLTITVLARRRPQCYELLLLIVLDP